MKSNLIAFDLPNTDLEQAQDLMWDAWDEPDSKKRKRMARKALEISNDCADAYNLLALETTSLKKSIELYTKALEAGKRGIGTKSFDEMKGSFWGFIETRPFMRAKEGLAECLVNLGELNSAITHFQEMLELNPNDNQGIRHLLCCCLYRTMRDEELLKLFAQYPKDPYAHWNYHSALLFFRQGEKPQKANRALKKAIERNPHVPKFLLGEKNVPKLLPEYIQIGHETEAVEYVSDGKVDWRTTRGALPWLKEHS